jgi:biopolymer transport protein ExbD
MIPLINIVFLLLIFFLVAGQIKNQPNQDIELPSTQVMAKPNTQENKQTSARIELFNNGETWLNGTKIEIENLTPQLDQLKTTHISLFADGRANAQQLDSLLKSLPSQNKIAVKLYTQEKTQ